VVLAATLSATHVLPVEGLALLIGIDRFMSEARSVTNIIGNGVATVVVSKMSAEFDPIQADAAYAERFGADVKFNLKPIAVPAAQGQVSPATMMSPQPD
jgi:aerobic C4-dicarboxylate transport protein